MKFNKEIMESDGRRKEEMIIKKYVNPIEKDSMPDVYPTNSRRSRTFNSKSKSKSRSKSRNKRSGTPVSLSMF